jgi:hypothetical protein
MADTFAKELNRCASEAHRLLDSSVPADGKARLLLSAARVLADASGPGIEETSTPTAKLPVMNPEDDLWDLTLAVTALRGQSDELRGVAAGFDHVVGGAAIIPARIQRLREI